MCLKYATSSGWPLRQRKKPEGKILQLSALHLVNSEVTQFSCQKTWAYFPFEVVARLVQLSQCFSQVSVDGLARKGYKLSHCIFSHWERKKNFCCVKSFCEVRHSVVELLSWLNKVYCMLFLWWSICMTSNVLLLHLAFIFSSVPWVSSFFILTLIWKFSNPAQTEAEGTSLAKEMQKDDASFSELFFFSCCDELHEDDTFSLNIHAAR